MRPDPPRTGGAPHRPGAEYRGATQRDGGRSPCPAGPGPDAARPDDDRAERDQRADQDDRADQVGRRAADLAALRAIAALLQLPGAVPPEAGLDPPSRARMDVIRDLLIAHLAGGRAGRALGVRPTHR